MTGKTALHNIIVSFDEMGLICSNIGYKEFFEYALHFKDIFKDEYDIIKKDLDRLEKLEIANKNNEGLVRDNVKLINRNLELEKEYNYLKKEYDTKDLECIDLLRENQELRLFANKLNNTNFVLCGELATAEKYKQALEKACERLDDDCPVSQELIDDLDCENCNNNCKECWKKFFLKEVFEDE